MNVPRTPFDSDEQNNTPLILFSFMPKQSELEARGDTPVSFGSLIRGMTGKRPIEFRIGSQEGFDKQYR